MMGRSRARIRCEWDDLMDSLVVGSKVTSYALQGSLNGRYWTVSRIGYYLRGDPRVRRIGREEHGGYTVYEVIG